MSKFQIILLAFCVVFLVAGIAVFSMTQSSNKSPRGETVLWGTVPELKMEVILSQIRTRQADVSIKYVEKSPAAFDQEFIQALAIGKGPDAILIPHDSLLSYRNKIVPIPYQTFSERSFRDTFVNEGELFLGAGGSFGLPFLIDPLVLYWNRDLFASAGIATPPKLWQDFLVITPKLTLRKGVGESVIIKSAVALGEYQNIENAKEILSALFAQAGAPIGTVAENGRFVSTLNKRLDNGFTPAESVFRFYTQFIDPQKTMYSWNRSFLSARAEFLAGDLATYVGFASELPELRSKNPNLNFDVSLLPQTNADGLKSTFGRVYAIALVRGGRNPSGTLANAFSLTSTDGVGYASEILTLPPVRRDLLSVPPIDPYKSVFYNSALISRGWLDPNPLETAGVFRDIVESIGSGRTRLSEAVAEMTNRLNAVVQ